MQQNTKVAKSTRQKRLVNSSNVGTKSISKPLGVDTNRAGSPHTEIATQTSKTTSDTMVYSDLGNKRHFSDNELREKLEQIVESSTQTSKTILELAIIQTNRTQGEAMSPDSLTRSPRENDSPSSELSNCALYGSSDHDACFSSSNNSFRRDIEPIKGHEIPKKTNNLLKLNKSLTTQFLEKVHNRNADNHSPFTRSKSYVGKFQPNYPTLNYEVIMNPPNSPTQVSIYTQTTQCSLISKNTNSESFSTYLLPTTATLVKNKMIEIERIKEIIPPTRRGRSTSPPCRARPRFEAKFTKKVPYIDLSQSNFGSDTTVVRRSCFDIDFNFGLDTNDIRTLTDKIESNPSAIDSIINASVNKLRDVDWNTSLIGMSEIIEICRIVDTDMIMPHMTLINQRLIQLLKSPRSYVSRIACQAAGHLFEYMKDTRRPEFDDIINLLLCKTADANKFIRKNANLALDCMVTHISTYHAVRTLCTKGPVHKNPLVRQATVRLLICTTVIAGPEFILNPNNNDYTRKKIFTAMATFVEDKHQETRKYGERLYKLLCKEPRFDTYLRKYFEKEFVAKFKKTLMVVSKK